MDREKEEIPTPGWKIVDEDEYKDDNSDGVMEGVEEEGEEEDMSDEKYEEYYEEVRATILAMKELEDEAKEEALLKRGTEHKRRCVESCPVVSPDDNLTLSFGGK